MQDLRLLALICVSIGVTVGCKRTSTGSDPGATDGAAPMFVDVAQRLGLRFVQDPGAVDGRYSYPQIMGSGGALLDFDDDGRLDLYLINNAGPDSKSTNHLFHQEADGTFKDVSAGSGLDVAGFGMGAAVGDVNNDGRVDLVLTEHGGVHLFLNRGAGKFSDVSKAAGIDDPLWATSACFFDYDRDGLLDLVVTNYLQYDDTKQCLDRTGRPDYCGPGDFAPVVTMLFHNVSRPGSDDVRFENVTIKSGLAAARGTGMGVTCADFDGDGWPDIFVANDQRPNHLWINQHDGTFIERAVEMGVAYDALGKTAANMGIAVGDLSGAGNGLPSLFVTHLVGESHTLWSARTPGVFEDRTAAAGLANPSWHATGFGTALGDFNNDGSIDLAIAGGAVRRGRAPLDDPAAARAAVALGEHWGSYAERNQLFINDGAGHFRDISMANPAFTIPAVSRALMAGDIDNDGGLDLVVTTVAGPVKLFRNIAQARGHWLLVRAIDPALKRDAYGAVLTLTAGGKRQTRWLNPGSSYLCSGDPRAHFGLGSATQFDSIGVLWPDGTAEQFPGGPGDRVITIRKGEGSLKKVGNP